MQYLKMIRTLKGEAPLLMHNGDLADPTSPIVRQIQQISRKRDKTDADLEEMARLEWYGGLYLEDKKICVPGEMIEAMLIQAASKKRKGSQAKSALVCEGVFPLLYPGPADLETLWKDPQYRMTTLVRLQGKRFLRTRPRFPQWQVEVVIHYLDALLNERDILEYLKTGGLLVGLGDWRPRYGRFTVENPSG